MKKSFIYVLIIAFFATAVGFIVVKYNKGEEKKASMIYGIKERKGTLAKNQEWVATRAKANALTEAIRNNPEDIKSRLALASIFLLEARITGDFMYYDMAAMKYVNDVLKKEPDNFEALIYKAVIQMSQHHFAEGLATAEQAQKLNPYNAYVYGIMVDGHVEMGNYTAAVESSDKMVSIRPDLRSYSRIAYLREIHGDMPGAIEAMKLAVEAGMSGEEGTEWCRVQLGQLYEHANDTANAALQYNISLQERPGYAYALAGLARIAVTNKEYEKALEYYTKAYETVNDYSFREEMVNVHKASGDQPKAMALGKELVKEMTKPAEIESDSAGHYSDRELAYVYLAVNEPGKALEHALAEYRRRPDNIDVNETLAWVYYNKGDYAKALPHIKTALRTNSKNPNLLARANMIYQKTGVAAK